MNSPIALPPLSVSLASRFPSSFVSSSLAALRSSSSLFSASEFLDRLFIASLDTHDGLASGWLLEKFTALFGATSSRVLRYRALRHEALCQYEEAEAIYKSLLDSEPANLHALKRQVAIFRAKNRPEDAVKALVKYLKVFSSDEGGWSELAALYKALAQLELAAFAVEELLLIAPENWLYHLQYAELLFSSGKIEGSRQYFIQAVELRPSSVRALYGLIESVKASTISATAGKTAKLDSAEGSNASAASGSSSSVVVLSQSDRLYYWAVERLLGIYQKKNPKYMEIVKKTLKF